VSNICIIASSSSYRLMFEKLGLNVVDSLFAADVVCFTGGEDVDPSLYKERKHKATFSNIDRDRAEQTIFRVCVSRKIPMVGICRGAQFLNVANGGKLYQHVTGHTVAHKIYDFKSKKKVEVTSTHHQMMRPTEDAEVIAAATHQAGTVEFMQGDACITRYDLAFNTEVVWYKATSSLCFQPHPEFFEGECRKYFFNLFDTYISL